MPKVKLTSADWQWIEMLLEDNAGHVSDTILKDIRKQLDGQEN